MELISGLQGKCVCNCLNARNVFFGGGFAQWVGRRLGHLGHLGRLGHLGHVGLIGLSGHSEMLYSNDS